MTYYRTVYEIEVLSKIPPNDLDNLDQIAYDITQGEASGKVERKSVEEVDAGRAAELLEAQGSEPTFLLGSDYEEGYDAGTSATVNATLDPDQRHSPEWVLGWDRAQSDLHENFGPNA